MSYPVSVKVIRVSCLSRVHSGIILRAFELGADGVMLLGCEPGNCHFETEPAITEREYEKAQNVLSLLGLQENRLSLTRLPRGDGKGFVKRVNNFIARIKQTQAAIEK